MYFLCNQNLSTAFLCISAPEATVVDVAWTWQALAITLHKRMARKLIVLVVHVVSCVHC